MESLEEQATQYGKDHLPWNMREAGYEAYVNGYRAGALQSRLKSLFWFCAGIGVTILILIIW